MAARSEFEKLLARPALKPAAELFRKSVEASKRHSKLAAEALLKYGDHGSPPADVKDKLRNLARQVTEYSNQAHRARPPRVQTSTMRKLGQAVALKYGAGFYGPQPPRGPQFPRTNPARKKAAPKKKRAATHPGARAWPRYAARIALPTGRIVATREFSAVSDAAALKYANGLLLAKLPARAQVVSLKAFGPEKKKLKSNPSARELDDALERARVAFERFTGHSADFVEAHLVDDSTGAAWALGPVSQIGYIATRDGETAEYVHKFRHRSRPLLAASSDGETLYLLGGAYRITDRGITDA